MAAPPEASYASPGLAPAVWGGIPGLALGLGRGWLPGPQSSGPSSAAGSGHSRELRSAVFALQLLPVRCQKVDASYVPNGRRSLAKGGAPRHPGAL